MLADGELVFDDTDDEADLPTDSSRKKAPPEKHHWQAQENVLNPPTGEIEALLNFEGKSATEIMEYFLDKDFFSLLSHESKRYSAWKGLQVKEPSTEEWKHVLATLFLSGYHQLPSRRHYWSSRPDFQVKFITDAMSRNRFEQILSTIHFADNQRLDKDDRMSKLRPLMSHLEEKFKAALAAKTVNFNVDESMIPYYGRHSLKQFIRGKPVRFGFKTWCLNAPNGYLVTFDVYQGAHGTRNAQYEKMCGKTGAAVMSLIDKLPDHIPHPIHLYMDNLFTTFPLMNVLNERGVKVTGTMRQNRVPKSCPLTGVKEMKKKDRGTISLCGDTMNKVNICRWKDNSVVTVASTASTCAPTGRAKRWSSRDKKRIDVNQPKMIGEYNQSMGGTDRMDQNIGKYRISIRSKKWWWSIFTWLLSATASNAWLLFRVSNPDVPFLDFLSEFVQVWASKLGGEVQSRRFRERGTNRKSLLPDDIRVDGLNHLIIPTEKQGKCKAKNCTSRPVTQCQKCAVYLCVKCFSSFHQK